VQIQEVNYMMYGIIIVMALFYYITWMPLISIGIIYLFLLGCGSYEEYVADKAMLESCRTIKQNGEKKL